MIDLRRPRVAVSAMFFLNGALFGVWAARIPAFVDRFAIDEGTLGLLLLALAAGAIASFPLAGRVSDRIGAARLTRLLAVVYAVALVLLALAPSLGVLALCLTLFGAGHGAMDVAMNAWATEVERHLDKPVMSSFHALFSIGTVLGAASGYLAIRAETDVALQFTVAAAGLGIVTLWLASRHWPSAVSTASTPGISLPKGPLVVVGMIAAASSLGEGAMADWSAVYLDTVTGATEAQAALGYATFSAAMVAVRLTSGLVLARLGPVRTARLSGVLAFTGVLLVVLSTGLAAVLAGFALMGMGYAVIMPLAMSRAAQEPGIGAGRAIASVATLGYGGMLLGPPLIGFLAGLASLREAFLLLAALALLIVVLAGILRRG